MKKIIVNLMAIFFLCGAFLITGQQNTWANEASEATSEPYGGSHTQVIRSGNYEYGILNEELKTAALMKVYNYDTTVVLPDVIDGYKIVQIGIYDIPVVEKDGVVSSDTDSVKVFPYDTVKKLVIPEGVERIGVCAFSGMDELSDISFPKSLYTIEEGNFGKSKPTVLKQLEFPGEKIHIGYRCFANVTFEKVILNGCFSGYDDDHGDMELNAKKMVINTDYKVKGYDGASYISVDFGSSSIDEFIIGKKVENIIIGPSNCKKIILKNPKTKLNFYSPDECDIDRVSAVITKNIKCKMSSGKYVYSWKPLKIKNKKYTVKYVLSYKKDNGKYRKLKTCKKTSVTLLEKKKLRVEVKAEFKKPKKVSYPVMPAPTVIS